MWRQRWLIVAVVVLALVGAGIRIALETKSYSSTAYVNVPAQPPSVTATASAGTGANGATTGTPPPDLTIVTSGAVGSNAAKLLHEIGKGPSLVGDIKASFDGASNTISISASTGSAASAVHEANAFAAAYVSVRQQQNAQLVTSLNNQLNRTNAQIANLRHEGTNSTARQQIDALNTQATTLNGQIATAQTAPLPTLGQRATSAALDTGTSKIQILGIAVAIGLIAGAGLALLRHQFDTRVRSAEQMEEITGHPLLAQLPFVRRYRRGTDTLAVVTEPHGQFASAIRELRTSSRVLLSDTATPVVVVTSSIPNEGKTLVTANLAASWAQAGQRIALVSGDMRRPAIQAFFGTARSEAGLSDLIVSGASAEEVAEALHPTEVDGLLFLSSGHAHGDPADRLASTAMNRVMSHLRAQVDVVIIDSPPVLAAADASIISGLADGVIVVVRADKTSQKELTETIKRLDGAKAPILGTAANRLKNIAGNAYGDYYRARPDESPPESRRDSSPSPVPGDGGSGAAPAPDRSHTAAPQRMWSRSPAGPRGGKSRGPVESLAPTRVEQDAGGPAERPESASPEGADRPSEQMSAFGRATANGLRARHARERRGKVDGPWQPSARGGDATGRGQDSNGRRQDARAEATGQQAAGQRAAGARAEGSGRAAAAQERGPDERADNPNADNPKGGGAESASGPAGTATAPAGGSTGPSVGEGRYRTRAPDSASPDSASPDSASPDSASPDSASPDSASPDSASPDSTRPDSTRPRQLHNGGPNRADTPSRADDHEAPDREPDGRGSDDRDASDRDAEETRDLSDELFASSDEDESDSRADSPPESSAPSWRSGSRFVGRLGPHRGRPSS